FVYMGQREKNRWGPPCKLRAGPGADFIKPFAIWAARRLRRRSDPHDEVSALDLRPQLRRRLFPFVDPRHVDERHGRMPFQFEKIFGSPRSRRQGPDGASGLLRQCIQKTRFSRIDLSDQNDPHWRDWPDRVGDVALSRGADLLVREGEAAGIELYRSA